MDTRLTSDEELSKREQAAVLRLNSQPKIDSNSNELKYHRQSTQDFFSLLQTRLNVKSFDNKLYQDLSLGYLFIEQTSQNGRYEQILIQVAIEYSLKLGLGGRISLHPRQDASQFYFQLGFLPDSDYTTYLKLLNGENVAVKSMYLPKMVITAWKKIIAEQPIWLLPEEAIRLCKPDVITTDKKESLTQNLDALIKRPFLSPDAMQLVKAGANPNSTKAGYALLHKLFSRGTQHSSEIKTLIKEYSAEINIKDKNGQTPLQYMFSHFMSKDIEFLEKMVSFGADLNVKDNDGQTLLHSAVKGGCSIEIIQWLIEKGLDVTARDNHKKRVLDFNITEPGVKEYLRNEIAKSQAAKLIQQQKDELISDLQKHIDRLNPNKDPFEKINFRKTPFRFPFFKSSQEKNRIATYLLAVDFQNKLKKPESSIREVYNDDKIKLFRKQNGATRGINSDSMNANIKRAKSFIK